MADQQEQKTQQVETGTLLDGILEAGEDHAGTKRERGRELIGELVGAVLNDTVVWDENLTRTLKNAMGALDEKISTQLAAVMHAPEFSKLEGTWRGLHHLVKNSKTSETLQINVLNVPKRELYKELEKADATHQSEIYKKVYTDRYGMFGGAPFSALIGDYEFSNHPEDIELLELTSKVAAAAHAPFISAASPELFGLRDFTRLSKVKDLPRVFQSVEYAKWKAFRESDDSRYVSLTMPRVLARLPFGKSTKTIDEFDYEEVELDADGNAGEVPHEHYCWMNSAYVHGTVLTGAFSRTGFCTRIRGVEFGGKVEGLPMHFFKDSDADTVMKCPSEIGISMHSETVLSELGFLPICHFKDSDFSVFIGGQSCNVPAEYDDPIDSENAQIMSRLPYTLAASRIAHYLKMMAYDKIGSPKQAKDIEQWLNSWITSYVSIGENVDDETKAKYPLADASVKVVKIPGKAGAYAVEMNLKPWLQLEELKTSVRMVAEIPKKG